MEIKRVFDILKLLRAKPDDLVVAHKKNKNWETISGKTFIENVNYCSISLLSKGFTPGDKIAIISNNRPEWNFIDFACQQLGIITVPVFPTASLNDMSFILQHAEVKAVFYASKDVYDKLISIQTQLTTLQLLVSFNKLNDKEYSFQDFTEEGKMLFETPGGSQLIEDVTQISGTISSTDAFTILYTSGTTGHPKGVVLSHNNLVSNVLACGDFAPFHKMTRALSFLPLNHVYERMLNTLYLYHGITIYYAEGLEKIGDNLKEVKPQIFGTVPRLLERVYDKLISAGEKLSPFKKKLFFWALNIALDYNENSENDLFYSVKRKLADRLVYSKWRAALGGEIICAASGGAALQPRLAKVFCCAGIPILEGYGLTETSPVVSVNTLKPDGIRFGTVGKILDSVQVKIAEDGEILVKGPCVMQGYYNNSEATAEVIDEEGFFHTGDIGTFIEGTFLKITDRKKEIFKTSSGKYIAPLILENKLKECRLIEQAMIIGEGEKFASALIVPSPENTKEWCLKRNITFTSMQEIIEYPEFKNEINLFIRNLNKSLAPFEQIKRPELLALSWTVEGGELTPKLSMKRKIIADKNKDLIAKIFGAEEI